MNDLTDSQRETLKTLPTWYLTRLREAVARKRDLDEAMLAEEDRINRLRDMIQEWKQKHEDKFNTTMAALNQRLASSSVGVSQAVAHGDKQKQLQLQTLEDQLKRRQTEIKKVDQQLLERQSKIDDLKRQISDIRSNMDKKKAQMEALNGDSFARSRINSVARTGHMTLRPSFIAPNSPMVPTSPRVVIDTGPEPTNTPETADPISKIDIDAVPSRVVLESLLEVMLEPSFTFVSTLAQSVKANEQDRLAKSIVEIFTANGEFHNLLRATVTTEVANTQEIGTLFRSNSIASRMMSAYSRAIGMEYLKSLLKPKIDAIISEKENLEIDQMKLAGDQVEAQRETLVVSSQLIDTNISKLTSHAIDFFQNIIAGKARAPLEYYIISNMLKEIVGAKFAANWKIAIGGYLFLRLMCPLIFMPPDEFGYDFESVHPDPKRTLVLVSKILQNLANLQPKFVEEVMMPFSSFVTFNQHSIEAYFEYMTHVPTTTPPTSVPDFAIRQQLREILILAASSQARLIPALSQKASDTFTQLWHFNKAAKLLVLYNHLTTIANKLPFPQDHPHVTAFLEFLVPTSTTSSSLLLLQSNSAYATPRQDFKPEEAAVCLAILEISARLDFSMVENADLAAAIYPLWEFRKMTSKLMQYAIDVFLTTTTKSNRSLKESAAAQIFSAWTLKLLPPIAKSALAPSVFFLFGKKESLTKREILMEVVTNFLDAMISSLADIPEAVHQVCTIMESAPRLGIQSVIEFVFGLFWVKALEDPESYTVPSGGGDRLVKKGLLMVADVLTLIISGSRDRQNATMDTFLTTSTQRLTEAVASWIAGAVPKKPSDVTITWEELSVALDSIRFFVGKNMSPVSSILEQSATCKYVKFHLHELVAVLVTHTAAKANTK